jgi:endonuclease YncB( thermonuclease family)
VSSLLFAGKFGNQAMPMANEAMEFTRQLVDKKVVRVKLLRKDQYNRVVGKVFVKGRIPFVKSDLTLRLAERGYATLYTGGGAEYDGKRELIEKKIAIAKKKKRGIWKNGSTFETPAEYKRRVKNGNIVPATAY